MILIGNALTLNPNADPKDIADISGDGLKLARELLWTVDFDRAKDAGILNWLQARRWRRLRSDEFPRRRRTAETELKDKQR